MSMTQGQATNRPVYVVTPFYKNPELAVSLFESLQRCKEELKDISCTLVAINDSPDDQELGAVLCDATQDFSTEVPCLLLRNQENSGFVRSVNRGLKAAVEAGADVVLLNSDTIVYPGALREIQRVAYLDSMIGFVSPRSNNATICSFPPQEEFRELQPADAHAIFSELSPHLPAFHYVPTAVGFCMFIKLEILRDFKLFDEAYGLGYNEENDLVMRANRCGYRAALANHAFVYHFGERSFSLTDIPTSVHEERNRALLTSRYPEYLEHVRAFFDGPHHRAEVLLTGLLKDARGRCDIVFDFSSLGSHYNGTFEAVKQILKQAARSWKDIFNIYVLANDEPARFHGLHKIPGIFLVPLNTNRVFAVAFRFGQPFQYDVITRMNRLAVFNVYSMLDPIAWDCLYLNGDDLDEMWRTVFLHADAVTYISDFAADEFRLRFQRRPGLKELVCYLSLDTREYLDESDTSSPRQDYLLIVGNHFAHKHVRPTVEALSHAFPREKIVALGVQGTAIQNVTGYSSGHLSEEELHFLFLNARAVIFPSFYEGFGIPIIRSLSYRKTLFARAIRVNEDLHAMLGRPEDFILYDSTEELIAQLKRGIPEWKNSVPSLRGKHDWATSTKQLGDFLHDLIQEVSFSDVLIPRLSGMRLTERIAQLKQQIPHLQRSVTDRDVRINQLQREVADLQVKVRDRELRIEDLLSSLSWAITAPLRSAGSLWIRAFGDKSR